MGTGVRLESAVTGDLQHCSDDGYDVRICLAGKADLEAAGDPDGFVWTVFVIRKIHALRYAGSHLFQYADPVLWSGNELSAERE